MQAAKPLQGAPGSPSAVGAAGGGKPRRQRADWPGVLYILPALLVVAILVVYPTEETIRLSLLRASGPAGNLTSIFVGTSNYIQALTSKYFLQVLGNTITWTIATVVLQYVLGLMGAVILNQPFPGRAVVRALIILPWAVPGIVVAVAWRWVYHADFGMVNVLLGQLGLQQLQSPWLGQESTALAACIIANIWQVYPLAMLMLLAGMQSIPEELLDAADIDGANSWQHFIYITVPLLRPVSVVLILLMAIWGFNGFVVIYGMTGGGPGIATEIFGLTIYRMAFSQFQFGAAAAWAVIMLVFMVVFAAMYIRTVESGDR